MNPISQEEYFQLTEQMLSPLPSSVQKPMSVRGRECNLPYKKYVEVGGVSKFHLLNENTVRGWLGGSFHEGYTHNVKRAIAALEEGKGPIYNWTLTNSIRPEPEEKFIEHLMWSCTSEFFAD